MSRADLLVFSVKSKLDGSETKVSGSELAISQHIYGLTQVSPVTWLLNLPTSCEISIE